MKYYPMKLTASFLIIDWELFFNLELFIFVLSRDFFVELDHKQQRKALKGFFNNEFLLTPHFKIDLEQRSLQNPILFSVIVRDEKNHRNIRQT